MVAILAGHPTPFLHTKFVERTGFFGIARFWTETAFAGLPARTRHGGVASTWNSEAILARVSRGSWWTATDGDTRHGFTHGIDAAHPRIVTCILTESVATDVGVWAIGVAATNGDTLAAGALLVVQTLLVLAARHGARATQTHLAGGTVPVPATRTGETDAGHHGVASETRWAAAHLMVVLGLTDGVRATGHRSVTRIKTLVSDASLVAFAIAVATTADDANVAAADFTFGAVTAACHVTTSAGTLFVDRTVSVGAANRETPAFGTARPLGTRRT